MLHLIPSVRTLSETGGHLPKNAIYYNSEALDERLVKVLSKLPFDKEGTPVSVTLKGDVGEGYTLDVTADEIRICADGPAGAFYALQTLRQIFANGTPIPCLHIEDAPDFAYRGFYHDVTRGKVPTVATLKRLIDQMAYYKLNSLQLYVEHTFEFKETEDVKNSFGYLTGAELEELDAYCKENFIDFIPSLATFGHMYEILQQPQYQHLRVLEDFTPSSNFLGERMRHHTIDPTKQGSIELVQSLIDQFTPHFTSEYFNLCGDETFDLKHHPKAEGDHGQMYVEFVDRIIRYLKGKNKKVMMWADILLKHPETIEQLPEDTVFLNWDYSPNATQDATEKIAALGRPQIVCPGTWSWDSLSELTDVEEKNISKMIDYGKKHGAIGVLNTNWGDYGNPCSIELAEYGMVFGAAKSWSADTEANDAFHRAADRLLYRKDGAFNLLSALNDCYDHLKWKHFVTDHYKISDGVAADRKATEEDCRYVIGICKKLLADLKTPWDNDEYRQELILAATGFWVMAEITASRAGYPITPTADAAQWLRDYSDAWRSKNKESELRTIIKLFSAPMKEKL